MSHEQKLREMVWRQEATEYLLKHGERPSTDWWIEKLAEQKKELGEACRKIYVDGADWSEWGMTREEAGKEFDKAFSEIYQTK